MYTVLDKDSIEMEIIPYIPNPKRSFKYRVAMVALVNAMLYKLKTGMQREQLPVGALFSDKTADLAGFILWDGEDEVFGFGKYKGQKVSAVLEKYKGYFAWVQNAEIPLYTKKVLT